MFAARVDQATVAIVVPEAKRLGIGRGAFIDEIVAAYFKSQRKS